MTLCLSKILTLEFDLFIQRHKNLRENNTLFIYVYIDIYVALKISHFQDSLSSADSLIKSGLIFFSIGLCTISRKKKLYSINNYR